MFYVNHDSLEMSILIFFTKKKKKRRKLECPLQILLGSLRIKNKHADLTLLTSKFWRYLMWEAKTWYFMAYVIAYFFFIQRGLIFFLFHCENVSCGNFISTAVGILLTTHNIPFHREIRNIPIFYLWTPTPFTPPKHNTLSGAMKTLAKITGLDKSGYQVNSFLISWQKHMLWVLIRSTSVRRF